MHSGFRVPIWASDIWLINLRFPPANRTSFPGHFSVILNFAWHWDFLRVCVNYLELRNPFLWLIYPSVLLACRLKLYKSFFTSSSRRQEKLIRKGERNVVVYLLSSLCNICCSFMLVHGWQSSRTCAENLIWEVSSEPSPGAKHKSVHHSAGWAEAFPHLCSTPHEWFLFIFSSPLSPSFSLSASYTLAHLSIISLLKVNKLYWHGLKKFYIAKALCVGPCVTLWFFQLS